mmetsp:Transcript_6773/g.28534  ORF Transcript_6773/g.28534 Transcript_6773/m.28534 type:complete len:709 (-) Transcript_6773:36-2162(-)
MLRGLLTRGQQPAMARAFLGAGYRWQSTAEAQPMFSKILIANRGEIACRVIKTARRLGVRTVAVYSAADRKAMHVQMADEAYHIGEPPAAESYLLGDKILDIAIQSGAQAVHPGYGFLSENAGFAEKCDKKGVTFIGPPVEAILAMGSKSASKEIMTNASVPVVPGYHGKEQSIEFFKEEAERVGYPLMIKAVMGGGGKGMRIARGPKDLVDAIEGAKREAISSFGDDRLLIEKYIQRPRHVEVQVFADNFGECVYLFERDCSVQRRHQKVIEEAPAPGLTEERRKMMGTAAVNAAKAVGYRGAGTVEFIVDEDDGGKFYFMEMNTRLQVEHPVTELITGVDLVEQMIRVAAGKGVAYKQSDIGIKGWAVESRIYAEDPLRNFLPSIGHLTTYVEPSPESGEPSDSVRVDSGVVEGSEISMHYDPMISKLISYGKDRKDAIAHMMAALDRYQIRGVENNISFVRDVMENPRFIEGDLSTKFIQEEYPDGFHGHELEPVQKDQLVAVAATMLFDTWGREASISGRLPSHEGTMRDETIVVSIGDEDHECTVDVDDSGEAIVVAYGDKRHKVDYQWFPGEAVFNSNIDNNKVIVQVVDRLFDGFVLQHVGSKYAVRAQSKRQFELSKLMPEKVEVDTSHQLLSPMPGTLISVDVKVGETVAAGQQLAVVEAMKMQNILRAERDGVIASIDLQPGTDVSPDEVILQFEQKA